MSGLPVITAEGTLVGDPELRFTPSGVPVAKYRIACNERVMDKDTGQWRDASTTYLTGSAWRDLGTHMHASLSKGDLVIVTGVLRQREWEADDGTRRTEYEIDTATIGPSLRFTRIPKGSRASQNLDPWAGEGEQLTAADDDPPF